MNVLQDSCLRIESGHAPTIPELSKVLVLSLGDLHHTLDGNAELLGKSLGNSGGGVIIGGKGGHEVLLLWHVLHEPEVHHAREYGDSVVHAYL